MPPTDYDGILRLLFSDPRLAQDLLLGFVDSLLGEVLDWSTLKQVAARHVDESLKRSENDMIWEVRTRQDEVLYVYVMLEFQAQPDWKMALRMWHYVGQFYGGLALREEVRQRRKLPPVLPVVLYTGEKPWKAARDVADLVEAGPRGWRGSGLRLKYELVDVRRSLALDRVLRNLADAVFRLQWIESAEAWLRECSCFSQSFVASVPYWAGGMLLLTRTDPR